MIEVLLFIYIILNSFYLLQGTFSLTLNATSLFDSQFDDDDEYYDEPIALPEITKMSLSQSVEVIS